MALVIPTKFTAVDKFSPVLTQMSHKAEIFGAKLQRKYREIGSKAMDLSRQSFLMGTAIVAPLGLAVREAVKFEDSLADVQKTTQLQGKALDEFSSQILRYSKTTRSSINELLEIGRIGGQMGVAQTEIFGFVKAIDKFNVALGSDFPGGVEEATKSIAVLRNLFKETRSFDIATSITKTGNAINALSAKGVNVVELTDFVARIGQLPDAVKTSFQSTAAFGSVLAKSGITSEIGARGFGDVLLTASQNLPLFAKHLKTTTPALKELINQNPDKFITSFAGSLKDLDRSSIGNVLKGLKLGDVGVVKVVGSLASNFDMLQEFMAISNKEFKNGTSLLDEYSIKNETTAAKFQKMQNTFKAMSIELGTKLMPVLNDLLQTISPIISGIGSWMGRNKGLTSSIAKITLGLGAFVFAVSGVSAVVGAFSKVMVFAGATAINYGKAVVFAREMMVAFNALSMTNQYAIALAGATALAIGIYGVGKALMGTTDAYKSYLEVQSRAEDSSFDQRFEAKMLFKDLRNLKVGSDEYKSTLEKINAITPGIVDKYNLQAGAANNLALAEKNIAKALIWRATIQSRLELGKEKLKAAERRKSEGLTFMDYAKDFLTFGQYNAKDFLNEDVSNLKKEGNRLIQSTEKKEFVTTMKGTDKEGKQQEVLIKFEGLPDWLKPTFKTLTTSPQTSSTRN